MEDGRNRVALALLTAAAMDRQIAARHGNTEHATAAEVKTRMAEWVLAQPPETEDLRRMALLADPDELFVGGADTGKLLMSIGRFDGHDSPESFAKILHHLALVATDDKIDSALDELRDGR